MNEPVKLVVESVDFFVRNVRMRLPFRYGKACLVAAPLLHARVDVRDAKGRSAIGVSADMLPPKWFDKSPAKTYRNNIDDLVSAVQIGAERYFAHSNQAISPFALWQVTYPEIKKAGAQAGLNGLTSAFGSSLIERAVIDAAGRLSDFGFATMVHENVLGIDPEAIHSELLGVAMRDVFPSQPSHSIYIRHTVGLGDPITDAEITPADRIDDGLPQSLETWVRQAGIRFFKIKVSGNIDTDLDRLRRIAALLDKIAPGYQVTLDGNEQFHAVSDLGTWYSALFDDSRLTTLLRSVLFIEQPLERGVALEPSVAQGFDAIRELPPILLDESDDDVYVFERGVSLGYRGVSAKNCKGVYQALLNRMLAAHYKRTLGVEYVLSGEDLCNQPIVPLQQDLCTLSVLGVTHAERNGHHYCGSLDHVSQSELSGCLEKHGDLYERFGASAKLRIRDGQIRLGSLSNKGFGLAVETDFHSMTPLADWDFDSLGIAGE